MCGIRFTPRKKRHVSALHAFLPPQATFQDWMRKHMEGHESEKVWTYSGGTSDLRGKGPAGLWMLRHHRMFLM